MKKEWLTLVLVTLVTSILALGALRWFAPQLLGIPIDLQAVQVSETLPPFFEGVFGGGEIYSKAEELLFKDPFTRVRGRPFYFNAGLGFGPQDVLGFRNRQVPNVSDVIIIGDSQTYGNNATLKMNWPSQYAESSRVFVKRKPVVYGMAIGGWTAPQYLDMFQKAAAFQPRVMIVAFYSGNDPREAVSLVYSSDRWSEFWSDEDDRRDSPPSPGFPPPPSEFWKVRFSDGVNTVFTPSLRLVSNDNQYGVVRAGYRILAAVGQRINELSKGIEAKVFFTIIPTKELVYAKKVAGEKMPVSPKYEKLVKLESQNIEQLAKSLSNLPNVKYVDLVAPLQAAAMGPVHLYPQDMNGHPVAKGYGVIAKVLAKATARDISPIPLGLVAYNGPHKQRDLYLFYGSGLARFAYQELAFQNGWSREQSVPSISKRDFMRLPFGGVIGQVDPKRFGPALFSAKK